MPVRALQEAGVPEREVLLEGSLLSTVAVTLSALPGGRKGNRLQTQGNSIDQGLALESALGALAVSSKRAMVSPARSIVRDGV